MWWLSILLCGAGCAWCALNVAAGAMSDSPADNGGTNAYFIGAVVLFVATLVLGVTRLATYFL